MCKRCEFQQSPVLLDAGDLEGPSSNSEGLHSFLKRYVFEQILVTFNDFVCSFHSVIPVI